MCGCAIADFGAYDLDVPAHDPGDGRDGAGCADEDYGGAIESAASDLERTS